MKTQEYFVPNWFSETPIEKSYRSIFKWGSPIVFKHPNNHLFNLLKEKFTLNDDYFKTSKNTGNELVAYDFPISLSLSQISILRSIVGDENLKTDNFSRLRVAYGKTTIDVMRLRNKIIQNIPDVVLFPKDKNDVQKIVEYCNSQKIAIYTYSGGSSVTRGFEAIKGGITLDIAVHMNRVLNFNETDQTITVEPGISGPNYEKILNQAPETLKAKNKYTGGHYPQSFEFSTVGGWVVTRGAGQDSSYYGKIENIVVSQEYVTPSGLIETYNFPAHACGPDLNQIFMGSEGTFGILVAVTLKIFKFKPETKQYYSFMFPDWNSAISASQQIMQGEFGYPAAFRISDPEETDIALKLYGIKDTIIDKYLKFKKLEPNKRCLMLGYSVGEKNFAKNVKNQISKICRKNKATNATGYVAKKWEHGRFSDPYLRDSLLDFGIITDTLECATNWSNIQNVYQTVRNFIKSYPETICMCHISHAYPQGANLYFIFINKLGDINSFTLFHRGILDAILKSGASMSHHHGIGKLIAPWFVNQMGKNKMNILTALKKNFDENNIMNPGGTLGLDLFE